MEARSSKKSFQQIVIGITNCFDQLFTPFLNQVNHIFGYIDIFIPHAEFFIWNPNNGPAFNQIHQSSEIIFRTNGNLHGNRIGTKLVLDLFYNIKEISTGTVHFIDESNPGNIVFICLTPNGFRLRLNTTHCTENSNSSHPVHAVTVPPQR